MAQNSMHCPKLPWMIDFHSTVEGTIPNTQLKAAYADNFIEHNIELNVRSQVQKCKLTGIICTLGCSSNDDEVLQKMMGAGMTAIRLKMCHINHEECLSAISTIRTANDNYSKKIGRIYPLPIALDIRGPEIRTGFLKDPNTCEIELQKGDEVNITTDKAYEEYVTENMIYVDYQKINEIVEPGDVLYIDNGEIRLSAYQIIGSVIRCIVQNAGHLLSRASVTLPGIPIDLPEISEKDKSDLIFGVKNGVDAVFISGIKKEETIKRIREILGEAGKHIMVIAKIDCCQALCNIDAIIKEADGILINRNALGMDLPPEKLFLAQKSIIAKCNKVGIPVICSSQVLETMMTNLKPTKAEVLDVANVVLDGIDSLILSRETSIGDNPIQSITTLNSICKEAEAAVYQRQIFADLAERVLSPIEPIYAISISAVEASLKSNAAVIIVLTTSGRSAKILSKFRPRCPIVAVTRLAQTARQLHLYRGLDPIQYIKVPHECYNADMENRVQLGITWGKVTGFIRAGDAIVIVTGSRPGAGFTNSMKVVYASEFDALPME